MIKMKKIDCPTETVVISTCKNRFSNRETVMSAKRMISGNTTFVFQINTIKNTYYARFLPNDGRFNIEFLIHKTLKRHNINVPEILFFEEENAETGLSFMLEEEMPCMSLEEKYPQDNELKKILFGAGRQLAQINHISAINGFGVFDVRSKRKLEGEKKSFEENLIFWICTRLQYWKKQILEK